MKLKIEKERWRIKALIDYFDDNDHVWGRNSSDEKEDISKMNKLRDFNKHIIYFVLLQSDISHEEEQND